VAGDFTVTRLGPEEFWVLGGGAAERFHQRFFRAVPLPEGTTFESLTEAVCGFNVAGPRARDCWARLTNADLSNAAFPFFRSQRITVAGVDVVAIRVSFTGDLGWELHCAEADQVKLYEALLEAGRAVGAGPGGQPGADVAEAGKGYGSWGRDYSPEYWPQESGLGGLIRRDKDFLNKDSWLKIEANAPREEMVLLEIDATRRMPAGRSRSSCPTGRRWDRSPRGLWVFGRQVAGAGLSEGGIGCAGRDGACGDPGPAAHGAALGGGALRPKGPAPEGQGAGGGTGGVGWCAGSRSSAVGKPWSG
jgi:dimethylglycine dehydrogenase